MKTRVSLDAIYALSPDVVYRDIEGELIIVPLTSCIAQTDDELFSLNPTGRAVWELLDGKKALKDVLRELGRKFEGPVSAMEKDVLGLVGELLKRKMVVPVSPKKVPRSHPRKKR